MKTDSGATVSPWMRGTPEIPADGPLTADTHADVCVVGAGIAGLSVAHQLVRDGLSVVVLDDGVIGGGMTSRTSAHLVSALDDRFYRLEELHGEEGARFAAQSHTAAIDRIELFVETEGARCGFERVDGYLFAPPGDSDEELRRELDAARRAGLDVELVANAPMGDYESGPSLRFRGQAQFHPLEYLTALAGAVRRGGGRIFTFSHAEHIEGGRQAVVTLKGGRTVCADHVVVATNSPVNDRVVVHTKQAGYLTYVLGARIPRGAVERALYWDTVDPYHYIRLVDHDGELLMLVGGEDHKTGQDDEPLARFTELERWARDVFPRLGEVRFRWSGQVMEPVDSLAFIGKNPGIADNVYIVTGDSGNGLTHGTIAGMLIPDLIQGRANAWANLYDPSRKRLKAVKEFARETINMAAQYAGLVTPGDLDSADDIVPGEGAVLRRGLKKVAAYRDEKGMVHERSAVCPHLGCIVDWNSAEKSWDCPCHGSRFSATGKVFQGPANKDLAPVSAPGQEKDAVRRRLRVTEPRRLQPEG